jgi:hypothetical protein
MRGEPQGEPLLPTMTSSCLRSDGLESEIFAFAAAVGEAPQNLIAPNGVDGYSPPYVSALAGGL